MIQNNLLEDLAKLEHQQWKKWAQHAIEQGSVPDHVKSRWSQYFVPYSNLDEDIKELDREYARKILDIFEKYKKS
jgi:hypothetical protein